MGKRGSYCNFLAKSVLPMFSFKAFVVSNLTSWSLIYFEFIFVYGVRMCSNFIHVAVQFFQYHLLKRKSFVFNCIFLPCWSKVRCHRCMGLSLDFLSCSTGLYFCFSASTILSWLLQLRSVVWSQEGWLFQLHFSFPRLLWLFWVFFLKYKLKKSLFKFCEKCHC